MSIQFDRDTNNHRDSDSDTELDRISKLLATDEALITFIKKLVYSRVSPGAFSDPDPTWLQTVINLSVNEAIEKLEINKMVLHVKQNSNNSNNSNNICTKAIELESTIGMGLDLEPIVPEESSHEILFNTNNNINYNNYDNNDNNNFNNTIILESNNDTGMLLPRPSFSETEPSKTNSNHRLQKKSKNDINSNEIDVASTQIFHKKYKNKNNKNTIIPNGISTGTGGDNATYSALELELRPGSARSHSHSGRRGGHGLITSSAFNTEDFPPDAYATEDNGYTGSNGGSNDVSINTSSNSNSKHVHFREQLESVKVVANIQNELETPERKAMFYSHIDGDRANYCYQRQKETAEEAGFESWSEWVQSISDVELALVDEATGQEFDELIYGDGEGGMDGNGDGGEGYIWGGNGDIGDPYDENSDEDYDYMYNTYAADYDLDLDRGIGIGEGDTGGTGGEGVNGDNGDEADGKSDTFEFEIEEIEEEEEDVHDATDEDW